MANFDAFYTGSMAPPTASNGLLYPTPTPAPSSSVPVRSVPTVPINPATNAPYTTQALQAINSALGSGGKDQSQLAPNAYASTYQPPAMDGVGSGTSWDQFSSQMGNNFLSGDPGQTDWSVANQGMEGVFNQTPGLKALPPSAGVAPAAMAPKPVYKPITYSGPTGGSLLDRSISHSDYTATPEETAAFLANRDTGTGGFLNKQILSGKFNPPAAQPVRSDPLPGLSQPPVASTPIPPMRPSPGLRAMSRGGR